eukprot:1497878-Rhodomonas_salina.1
MSRDFKSRDLRLRHARGGHVTWSRDRHVTLLQTPSMLADEMLKNPVASMLIQSSPLRTASATVLSLVQCHSCPTGKTA